MPFVLEPLSLSLVCVFVSQNKKKIEKKKTYGTPGYISSSKCVILTRQISKSQIGMNEKLWH